MGELARNNNPPSRPQRRPQRRPRPQAPSKNRAQLQENLSAYIQLPADVRKYENANEITPEKITHAHLAIATALKAIQARIHRNRQLKQLFRDHQIKLQSPDYYLAIAVKESKLIPIDVSSSDARGYFQIKRSALDDVAEKAGLIIPPELVFSNKAPNTREQKRASVNNAIIGILYWHIMRDVYPKRVGLNWPEQDKDELAGLGYLMGPLVYTGSFVISIIRKITMNSPKP